MASVFRYSFIVAVLAVKGSWASRCSANSECNGGTCQQDSCVCPSGQFGPFCMSPCEDDEDCNGGLCNPDSFKCMCPSLQTGDNCEILNECDSTTPCANGGQCDMYLEPYSCLEPMPPISPSPAVTMGAAENCLDICSSGTTRIMALSASPQLFILGMISLI